MARSASRVREKPVANKRSKRKSDSLASGGYQLLLDSNDLSDSDLTENNSLTLRENKNTSSGVFSSVTDTGCSEDLILKGLNVFQKRAVEHYCGPLLVVAGAGSGKTRTLTHRIAYLIKHRKVLPESIVALTFTNKAAREMRERIEQLFCEQISHSLYGRNFSELSVNEKKLILAIVERKYTHTLCISTFHSFCLKLLRSEIKYYQHPKGYQWDSNFSVLDEYDVRSIVKEIVAEHFASVFWDLNIAERVFRSHVSRIKNLGISSKKYCQLKKINNYITPYLCHFFDLYEEALFKRNAFDFDDFVLRTVFILQRNPERLKYWHERLRHILVDEYQDTNRIQYALLRLLVSGSCEAINSDPSWEWENRSIFVVGDVDQSIYSFRGADFNIMMEFREVFCSRYPNSEIILEDNYRSVGNILEAANSLIEHNVERIPKVLRPTKEKGQSLHLEISCTDEDEARFIVQQIQLLSADDDEPDWSRFAVLYRTKNLSFHIEQALLRAQIPYKIVGSLRFFEHKEVKDIFAYLRVIQNPKDDISLRRIFNIPFSLFPSFSGNQEILDKLMVCAKRNNLSLWQVIANPFFLNSVKGINVHQRSAIAAFVQLISRLNGLLEGVGKTLSLADFIKEVISGTRYRFYISQIFKADPEEKKRREEIIDQICFLAEKFSECHPQGGLNEFIEVFLLDQEDISAPIICNSHRGKGAVSLMTIHASKGLEFPVVFLVGLEQGLFPLFSRDSTSPENLILEIKPEYKQPFLQTVPVEAVEDEKVSTLFGKDSVNLEEERRLCYVAFTRARERLFLSTVINRSMTKNSKFSDQSSQFLREIPSYLLSSNLNSAHLIYFLNFN